MQKELQQSFEASERQRAVIQQSASALTEADLSRCSSAEGWSIKQIIEHLVLSDETLGQAQDAGAVTTEEPMFRVLPRALRRFLILAAFKRDAVLPLPSPGVDPAGNVPLPELLERWEVSRAKMRRALETMQESDRRYSHPVLGPLTAGQMLELAQVHTAYHARQIAALQTTNQS